MRHLIWVLFFNLWESFECIRSRSTMFDKNTINLVNNDLLTFESMLPSLKTSNCLLICALFHRFWQSNVQNGTDPPTQFASIRSFRGFIKRAPVLFQACFSSSRAYLTPFHLFLTDYSLYKIFEKLIFFIRFAFQLEIFKLIFVKKKKLAVKSDSPWVN